jgi:peptidoglycan hydrolase-like protein with peptidoglycan-binding domain
VDFLATPHLWDIYETVPPTVTATTAQIGRWLVFYKYRGVSAIAGAIALSLISADLQAKYFPNAGTAYVAPPPGYNVNIRSGPGTRFPAVNTLRPGSRVALTGYYEDGWAQLTDRSWVAGNLVSSVPESSGGSSGAAIAYIAPPPGYNVNIRRGPGTRFPAVNTLARGTAITITGRYENGWAQLADGHWVAGNLIQVGQPVQRPIPPPQPPSDEFLQVGDRSPSVVPLEIRLRELNYVTSTFPADEYYGSDTAQAVRNFQRRNRLRVDGIAGPETRRVLYSAGAIRNPGSGGNPSPNPSPNRPVLRIGDRRPEVFDLEQRLQDLNYFGDVADQYFDRVTQEAVRSFQTQNGIVPANGVADANTQNVLYGNNAIPNGNSSIPPTTPNPPTNPGGMGQATIATNDGLDALAFSGPGTEYDLMGFLPNGTVVTLTGVTEGNWSELEDGSWIYTDFLDF